MSKLTLCGERNPVVTINIIRVFPLLKLDVDYFMRGAGFLCGVDKR